MFELLQITPKSVPDKLVDRLPTFSDLITTYGAFLTFVLVFTIIFGIMQYNWYKGTLKSKDEQIKRMDEKERDLFDRLMLHFNKKS